eukprot:GHVO01027624.1.p1 GENE.GHVO01027624.1~~GHVO01027624.1.p1  ORF type:complete len:153 (-),score=12.85 GHVO01027624.1:167-625(-)
MTASSSLRVRIFIAAFAAGVILKVWFGEPFRYAERGDIGITVFGVIVILWCILKAPYSALAPTFFADPLGALVGRWADTRTWYKNKTIAGSLAVFTAAALSLILFTNVLWRDVFGVSIAITLCEALGGRYDNLVMSFPLFAYYIFVKSPYVL